MLMIKTTRLNTKLGGEYAWLRKKQREDDQKNANKRLSPRRRL
jgi:hypothetical protein